MLHKEVKCIVLSACYLQWNETPILSDKYKMRRLSSTLTCARYKDVFVTFTFFYIPYKTEI